VKLVGQRFHNLIAEQLIDATLAHAIFARQFVMVSAIKLGAQLPIAFRRISARISSAAIVP
jgi:hypothetical protein